MSLTALQKKAQANTFVYSQLPRYDIQKFDGKKIPAGGKTISTPPDMHPQAYGLDADGRPCHHSSEHSWNKVYWEGFYDITESWLEYIKFSLESKQPVEMTRLLIKNGRKIGYQYLKINGLEFGYNYNV